VITSHDDGNSWSPEPQILVENYGDLNVMSVTLLRLLDGQIALFYLVKNSARDCRPRMSISEDEAATWSAPSPTIPAPGYFVVNNDRIIQLRSGRLVIPAGYHRAKSESGSFSEVMDHRCIFITYLSDDLGSTWRESATWWALPVPTNSGLQEPGVVELANGHLFAYCRTDSGYQWGTTSRDGGVTWSPPEPTRFISPCSPLSIKRLPPRDGQKSGDLLAIWNDHSGRFELPTPAKESHGRTPLTSAISTDEGRTWTHHRLLEDDPESGYCYTAIHPFGDFVLLAYCAGGKTTGSILNTLRMRKVSVDWFYGG
jgi:hypothetical protein